VTASLLTALAVLAFPVLIATALFTGVERTVSQTATWEIIDREGTIQLRLADAKDLEAEIVISARLRRYLQDKNPASVNVTFNAVFDLGIMRGRGPILTVDGISLDD
jgi:hypothetical protein